MGGRGRQGRSCCAGRCSDKLHRHVHVTTRGGRNCTAPETRPRNLESKWLPRREREGRCETIFSDSTPHDETCGWFLSSFTASGRLPLASGAPLSKSPSGSARPIQRPSSRADRQQPTPPALSGQRRRRTRASSVIQSLFLASHLASRSAVPPTSYPPSLHPGRETL